VAAREVSGFEQHGVAVHRKPRGRVPPFVLCSSARGKGVARDETPVRFHALDYKLPANTLTSTLK
jgi:hypothetical protein